MQKVKNKKIKFLLLFPLDICLTFIGIIFFKFFNYINNFFYQSMVRLFCVTGGKSNYFINVLTSEKGIIKNDNDKIDENKIEKISKEIEKKGYFVYENFLSDEICEKILNFCLNQKLEIRPSDKENWNNLRKPVYFNEINPQAVLYETPKNNLLSEKNISNLIFNYEIISICNKYLNCKPIFDHASLSISTSYSKNPDDKAAQRFHFDLDRPKWLKFLIYINDVNSNNGPHVFVEGTHKDNGIDKSILSMGYNRLEDEVVNKIYNNNVKKFNNRRGTLIIEDTRGLHKGDVVKSGYRCLLNIQFNSSNYGTKINNQIIPEENIKKNFFYKNKYTYQNLKLRDNYGL